MGIVDTVSQSIIDTWGVDALRLLQIYEAVYPPDLAITLGDDPSLFDFDIYGGDIGIAGFYVNATFESIIHLAVQDLLFRISTDKNTSTLFPSVGNTNIARLPRDAIKSSIAIAASDSPFIDEIRSIEIIEGAADEVVINIDAIAPTGDNLNIGFKI